MLHQSSLSEILGRYPQRQELKEGGQKTVYIVQDPVRGSCVLKIGHTTPAGLDRLCREVEILSALCTPWFPRQYEFHTDSDRNFAILEERLDASPLSDHLSPPWTLSKAAAYMSMVVCAMQELWHKKIVHRDLKPDNLLVTAEGHPRIVDLGIARVIIEGLSLTKTVSPVGPCTPPYAAPEQLINAKRSIDFRTDQFTLGIVLAQLLTGGVHPFDPAELGGESIVMNILTVDWRPSPQLFASHPTACVVLARMLSKPMHQRYRKPDDLRKVLLALETE